jgi:hypothetical protein
MYEINMHVYQFNWHGDTVWISATSRNEATDVFYDKLGGEEEHAAIELPDDMILSLYDYDDEMEVEKPCREWANGVNGYIGSTFEP